MGGDSPLELLSVENSICGYDRGTVEVSHLEQEYDFLLLLGDVRRTFLTSLNGMMPLLQKCPSSSHCADSNLIGLFRTCVGLSHPDWRGKNPTNLRVTHAK